MVEMRKLKSKKGVLFTLGLTFLTLVVLALAILIFHNSQDYEEIISKLAVLDRVYELDTSIHGSLGDIFNLKAGISIDITDSGVSFEEVLPNGNIKSFNNSLFQFKTFIESNLSNVNLTITNIEELPLTIIPKDIVYKHREDGGNIEVVPEQLNFNGYSLFIDTNKNVTCSWDVSGEMQSLNFSLEVKGDATNCELRTEKLNPYTDNEIRVDSIEDGNILIIRIGNRGGFGVGNNDGRLLINRTQDISVTARTTILTDQSQDGIRIDSITLGIDFSDFGIYKGSGVRVI